MSAHPRVLALLALLAGVVSLVFATAARAIIVHLPNGGELSSQPLHRNLGAGPLGRPQTSRKQAVFHGGPVMSSNTTYALYWDPPGAPAYPAGYASGVEKWFEDLAHDSGGLQNTDSLLVQYYGEAGEHANYNSHFGGALNDTGPYPANGCSAAPVCLTDAQIQAELKRYLEANALPEDLSHQYFVLTPPGVESCSEPTGFECSPGAQSSEPYCGYHNVIKAGASRIIYADDPYVNGTGCEDGNQPNGPADGAIAGSIAHEHSEMLTDPELNAWYDVSGEEVGDKCNSPSEVFEYGKALGKAPDGARYNQLINGDFYWYQQEWSNEAARCEQREAAPPTIKKLKPKAGPKSGGTRVTITGTGFVGTVTVDFGEAAGTNVEVTSKTTLSVTTPAGAPGTVPVTVANGSGTSEVTKKTFFKYKPKP